MSNSAAKFNRGMTFDDTGTTLASGDYDTNPEGQMVELRNTDPADASTLRSPIPLVAIVVRNTSTVALLPGMWVTWASGYVGKRVDGYARVAGEEVAGVVDDALPTAGVPVGHLFYLIVRGRVNSKMPIDQVSDIAAGAQLIALTVAASTGTTSGRVGLFTVDSIAQTDSYIKNIVARAVTARLSNVTNTNILVDFHADRFI